MQTVIKEMFRALKILFSMLDVRVTRFIVKYTFNVQV